MELDNSITPHKRNFSFIIYIIAILLLLIGFAIYVMQVNKKALQQQNGESYNAIWI